MKTIESVIGRDLQWVQPNFFKHKFELRNSSTVVATFVLPRLLSEEAVAESSDGCWRFTRKGFWNTKIFVSTCDNETPIVSFQTKRWSRKQTLQLPNDETVVMVGNIFGWRYTLQTETGELLAEVKRTGFFSGKYKVDLRRRIASYQELPWLVFLLWYMMILERRRQHAAAS